MKWHYFEFKYDETIYKAKYVIIGPPKLQYAVEIEDPALIERFGNGFNFYADGHGVETNKEKQTFLTAVRMALNDHLYLNRGRLMQ